MTESTLVLGIGLAGVADEHKLLVRAALGTGSVLKGRLHRVDAVLEVAALASVHVSRDSALDVARLVVIGLAQVDEHVIGGIKISLGICRSIILYEIVSLQDDAESP